MPVIAYDCGRGGLHVNADWVVFEPGDEDFQPVPPGQASHKVLVTNHANRVQPFIRYEMGDSVTSNPEPCSCGSPLPSIIVEGRNDDILRFTDMNGRSVAIMLMALWSVMKDTPGVYRFQAIQTTLEQLKVRLQTKAAGDEAQIWELVKQRVQNYLASHGLKNVQIVRAQEAAASALLGRDHYALGLADTGPPAESGSEVLHAVKRADPSTKVVLVTGSQTSLTPEQAALEGAEWLPKRRHSHRPELARKPSRGIHI